MRVVLCYPLLDLRFLTDPSLAPSPPEWPFGDYETVGSLGRVIALAEGGNEGEVRANAAILFESESNRRPRPRKRRWQSAPALPGIASVSGRRLLADSDGHVRIEIALRSSDPTPDALRDLLESILVMPVEVTRSGQTELVSAGFRFSRVYLQESAKTADHSDLALLDILVREGASSPFIVVLWPNGPPDDPHRVQLDPPNKLFPTVSCTVMELAGQSLGVWQIWNAAGAKDWLVHVRHLCQIVCYLSEVTLLTGLLLPATMAPYALSTPAVESFFRQRAGQLRRKSRGTWPVMAVQELAAQHLRVAIGDDDAVRKSLSGIRRDVAGDIAAILANITKRSGQKPIPTPSLPTVTPMKYADEEMLVELLADQALASGDTKRYFARLIQQADLPKEFKYQRAGAITGQPDADARGLIDWALNQGGNPKDRRYSTLGAILGPEIRQFGVEKAGVVAAMIVVYQLYSDPRLLDDLGTRFQIPGRISDTVTETIQSGPDFSWQGPNDSVELQGWLRPEPPDFLDVGFLKFAVQRSRSVCLVTVGATNVTGTGVLIDRDLILTNYHVLVPEVGGNLMERAKTVSLTFGNFTGANATGLTELKLDDAHPVVEYSLINELDFVLLRTNSDIYQAPDVQVAPFRIRIPELRSNINILQHPAGKAMKLAVDDSAVTYRNTETGIIQYVTRASSGSSGAPCFDEDWRLVALHHAERSRTFGTVREGILMSSIYHRISQHLQGNPVDA